MVICWIRMLRTYIIALLLVLGRKQSAFPHQVYVSCGVFIHALYQGEEVPFLSSYHLSEFFFASCSEVYSCSCPGCTGRIGSTSFSLNQKCTLFLWWYFVVVVQSLSRVHLFVTPWITAHQASLSIANSWSLLKLMSIDSVMPSNHLILCHPLLLLPSIFPSIRVFSNEPVLCIRWPKYWSFSFSISPSNEYSGLISFRIHWFDLLAVQGILKSLFQQHS